MPPDRGQGPAGLALRRGLGGEGPVRAGPASAGPRPGQHKLVNCKLTCIPQRTESPNRGHTHRTSNMRTQGILQGYGWRPCGRGGMADAPGLGPGPFGGGGSTPLARTDQPRTRDRLRARRRHQRQFCDLSNRTLLLGPERKGRDPTCRRTRRTRLLLPGRFLCTCSPACRPSISW